MTISKISSSTTSNINFKKKELHKLKLEFIQFLKNKEILKWLEQIIPVHTNTTDQNTYSLPDLKSITTYNPTDSISRSLPNTPKENSYKDLDNYSI